MDRKAVVEEAVLSTNSDAIIASDKEGKIFFWNPGAERIFGHRSADVLGQSLDIIIPDQLRQRHWDGYRQVMKSGHTRYGLGDVLAVPGITKGGNRISLEFTIIPLRDHTAELIGLAAIMRDVSDRFEELRALKQKLFELTKATRDAPVSSGSPPHFL
jgi:PAS domain S-box-containing protein